MVLKGGMRQVAACLAFVVSAMSPSALLALTTALTATGASDELRGRLETGSLSYTATERGFTTPQEILAAARSDYGTLVSILYDEGYYSPVVRITVDGREAASIPPLNVPRSINRVDISVTPGPQFRFGEATIGPLAPDTTLPDNFRRGQPAPSGVLEEASRAGIGRWRDVGHAKAKIAGQRIVADHNAAILNARIALDPGARLSFGKMSVRGNEDVRTDAIQRIAGFPSGEVFDPEKARVVTKRLRRTGTFKSVALREAETANPDGTLDFEVEVTEQLPRRIGFGAEISSNEGIDLSFNWTHRNFLGGAERFRFEARVRNIGGDDDIDGLLSARLDRPAYFAADYDLFYLAEIERKNEPNYSTTRAQLGAGVRRIFSDDLFGELGIAISRSEARDVFGERDFNLLSFPARLEWDKRDNKVSATRGFYVDTRLTPFLGLGGSASGMSAVIDGRGYISLGQSDRIVLAGRIQLGTILGASQRETSPDFLFYSGGAGSVRGQPYQSLGTAVNGGVAGGRSFLGVSAEVRAKITEKISLVGFYDFGAVDAGQFVNGDSPHHSGAGLGVRYDIGGIGPIRFDLALPVDGSTGDGLQFYVGIGQAF